MLNLERMKNHRIITVGNCGVETVDRIFDVAENPHPKNASRTKRALNHNKHCFTIKAEMRPSLYYEMGQVPDKIRHSVFKYMPQFCYLKLEYPKTPAKNRIMPSIKHESKTVLHLHHKQNPSGSKVEQDRDDLNEGKKGNYNQ
jgi:hypothetical protein